MHAVILVLADVLQGVADNFLHIIDDLAALVRQNTVSEVRQADLGILLDLPKFIRGDDIGDLARFGPRLGLNGAGVVGVSGLLHLLGIVDDAGLLRGSAGGQRCRRRGLGRLLLFLLTPGISLFHGGNLLLGDTGVLLLGAAPRGGPANSKPGKERNGRSKFTHHRYPPHL